MKLSSFPRKREGAERISAGHLSNERGEERKGKERNRKEKIGEKRKKSFEKSGLSEGLINHLESWKLSRREGESVVSSLSQGKSGVMNDEQGMRQEYDKKMQSSQRIRLGRHHCNHQAQGPPRLRNRSKAVSKKNIPSRLSFFLKQQFAELG